MPKIEVNEQLFFALLGERCGYAELAERLVGAKAELGGMPDESLPAEARTIKIELNDTNRPDLWSTAGVARALRLHRTGAQTDFSPYFSTPEKPKAYGNRTVAVDPKLEEIRPYMTAFVVSGKPLDEPMLRDVIQTQEKLCGNYGRKRRSISMGVYRSAMIRWPLRYKAVDPDGTSFVPLQCSEQMTCRQILSDHPKGREYGWILEGKPRFPLLVDDKKEVLSMAPIINSATLGAVQAGDFELLVEMTGTDMAPLLLATNVVACDFADNGYAILPCRVNHPYDTGFGTDIIAPFYFQQPTKLSLAAMNKLLGSAFSAEETLDALTRTGSAVTEEPKIKDGDTGRSRARDSSRTADAQKAKDTDTVFMVSPAPYRNDFLHEVDAIEDVMIGKTLSAFPPEKPRDFTIGRLLPLTLFSRKVKSQMVGLGYQEMVFNYLGSQKDFLDAMNDSGEKAVEISNPLSENYQFVRPSIIASLLAAEAGSGNAVYPHKIFEVGKIAYLDSAEITGAKTAHRLGFLTAGANANFNDAASEVAALLYFLGHEYAVQESEDPRFIPGRQADILIRGESAGVFGEVHPAILENCAITAPCAAGEINVEQLL